MAIYRSRCPLSNFPRWTGAIEPCSVALHRPGI